MRSIAICGDNVASIVSEPSFVTDIEMNGVPILCGLIHTDAPIFDASNPANAAKVFVRIRAFSCNYRDKAMIFTTATQSTPNRFNAVASEFVGEVMAVGAAVTDLQVGDRVIGNNTYPNSGVPGVLAGVPSNHSSKEYRIFHQAKLIKIPSTMPDEVAAAFSIGAQTTYSMLRKLQIQEGENILVTAAKSNTSLFAIQALKQYNVNVYAMSTTRRFETELLAMGVKQLIQIQPDQEDWIEPQIASQLWQEIEGFDCIIDPFFDVHFLKLFPTLKPGGRYTTCGLYDQYSHLIQQKFEDQEIGIRELLIPVMINNLQIIGNCIGLKEDLERAIADYSAGKFSVTIDSVFTDNQVADFFNRTFNHPERFGKVVYRYD
jgi:NADPH:quinone reductase-like Zn-dependent oxidoreductase